MNKTAHIFSPSSQMHWGIIYMQSNARILSVNFHDRYTHLCNHPYRQWNRKCPSPTFPPVPWQLMLSVTNFAFYELESEIMWRVLFHVWVHLQDPSVWLCVWVCESACMEVRIGVYGCENRRVWMWESACMDVWLGVYGCVTRRVWMWESVARSFLSLSGFSAECAHQFVDSFTWWGCFQFVVMLNEVTVNILVQTFVWTVISSTDSVFGVIWKVAPCARSFKLSSRSFGRLRSALRSLGRSAVALWGRPRLDPLWRGCPAAAAAFVAAFFRCSAFAPLLSAGWPYAVVKRRLAVWGLFPGSTLPRWSSSRFFANATPLWWLQLRGKSWSLIASISSFIPLLQYCVATLGLLPPCTNLRKSLLMSTKNLLGFRLGLICRWSWEELTSWQYWVFLSLAVCTWNISSFI